MMRLFVFTMIAMLAPQLLGQSDWTAARGARVPRSYCLVLSVKLQDPLNRDFEIRLPVRLGKHFHATAKNGSVTNDISGIVRPSISEKYALKLTVREWQSAASNMLDTTNFQLDLDEPQSAGPISSFVYLRTVTLSRLMFGESRLGEKRWHEVFRGRLAKVEVDQTLYERRENEDCFIAVRVTDVVDRPMGVDLRRFWNVIYPNSWGFSKTPAPELVDEERWIRKPMSEEDKERLMLDYRDHHLTTIMPQRSITYFRGFTFGRNIRKDMDSAPERYLIVGLDGVLKMTDGQITEEVIFPMNAADAERARWVPIRLPASWETIPQGSLVVEERP